MGLNNLPTPDEAAKLERLGIDTIRTLAIDAVQKANSGHPGAPMALAPVAWALWRELMIYDPGAPNWPNRDRFVLSNGHASMLLYAVLHLAGVVELDAAGRPTGKPAVSLDDIKSFRQLDSKCPGHPERGLTTGVETTTGPLGQGCGNSVGMAMASKWLAAVYNRPGYELFDFNVYVLCGDGDMMEGVASEAASLAGHLALDNLCWIYDSNRITIEGRTDLAFSEDVGQRFLAYGWDVQTVPDANDRDAFLAAARRKTEGRPRLIIVDSRIGWGSPNKEDTKSAHGEPLGAAEVKLTKARYGWPEDSAFLVPQGVADYFTAGLRTRGEGARIAWSALLERYGAAYPDAAKTLERLFSGAAPDGWDLDIPEYPADGAGLATRDSSGQTLNAVAKRHPWLLGGSADLAPSTKTNLLFEGAGRFAAGAYAGRNLHFGIREHAMGAVLNGLALCGLRVYGSGFLIFSDYMKPPIRLSALMELPVVYIFTHDSIGVGEDGPTHQPIEQLASLRSTPGLIVLRPADANEVAQAWRVIGGLRHEPACLILSRQKLATLDRSRYASAAGLARGAYILADAADGAPAVILIATGSEVALCVEAFETLSAIGVKARLVSMPSWELFERQDRAYRDHVLPPQVRARVAVEAGSDLGWTKWAGTDGAIIAMRSMGASAPMDDLMKKFGFTVETVLAAVDAQLAQTRETGR